MTNEAPQHPCWTVRSDESRGAVDTQADRGAGHSPVAARPWPLARGSEQHSATRLSSSSFFLKIAIRRGVQGKALYVGGRVGGRHSAPLTWRLPRSQARTWPSGGHSRSRYKRRELPIAGACALSGPYREETAKSEHKVRTRETCVGLGRAMCSASGTELRQRTAPGRPVGAPARWTGTRAEGRGAGRGRTHRPQPPVGRLHGSSQLALLLPVFYKLILCYVKRKR